MESQVCPGGRELFFKPELYLYSSTISSCCLFTDDELKKITKDARELLETKYKFDVKNITENCVIIDTYIDISSRDQTENSIDDYLWIFNYFKFDVSNNPIKKKVHDKLSITLNNIYINELLGKDKSTYRTQEWYFEIMQKLIRD